MHSAARALPPLIAAAAILACATAPSPKEGAGAEGLGEQALRSSFYLNAVPTLVEMARVLQSDFLDALELEPGRRQVVEKTIAETWTEERLYANAATSLEEQLPARTLREATARMTPEVQQLIKAGISDRDPEQVQQALKEAGERPDAAEREALARRIAAHMPDAKGFGALLAEVVELVADVAPVSSGDDALRDQLRGELGQTVQELSATLDDREAITAATVAVYHAEPTEKLRALADALDSESGAQLQKAALQSLIAGAKKTREELRVRLQAELSAAPK